MTAPAPSVAVPPAWYGKLPARADFIGRRLPRPSPEARLVKDLQQRLNVCAAEAAAEVAGGGGIGNALGSEGIEEHLVVAADLDVLQATAAGQEVVGDVQDVVALEVRQVPLEQVEAPVDNTMKANNRAGIPNNSRFAANEKMDPSV